MALTPGSQPPPGGGIRRPSILPIRPRRPGEEPGKDPEKDRGPQLLRRVTCRHRGGGHKRRYRLVDFKPLSI